MDVQRSLIWVHRELIYSIKRRILGINNEEGRPWHGVQHVGIYGPEFSLAAFLSLSPDDGLINLSKCTEGLENIGSGGLLMKMKIDGRLDCFKVHNVGVWAERGNGVTKER